MKNSHKHFLARLLVGAFLILGMGFWMSKFVVDASTWTVGGITWDNANFLNQNFWSNSPSSGDVITALFGSGDETTAYTMGRSGYNSGTCPISGMTVQYLTPGVSSIPVTLSGNTVYVLNEGAYLNPTDTTIAGDCVGFVGSGNVYIYNTGGYQETMFTGEGKKYVIFDNIITNGTYDGQGGSHPYRGSFSLSGFTDTTLNHLKMFNHGDMQIVLSQRLSLNNILSINNNGGITFAFVSHSVFNNIIIQNSFNGITSLESSGNVFNNIVTSNQQNDGIVLASHSSNNVFNNIYIYSNKYGIYTDTGSVGNTFYGNFKSFGNTIENLTGTNGNDAVLSASGYHATLGWSTGTLTTAGTNKPEHIVNVVDANSNYFLTWNDGLYFSGGQISGYVRTGVGAINYSFGGFLPTQIQPVGYSGNDLVNAGSYESTYFVGSTIELTTGSLVISGTQTTSSGVDITLSTLGTQTYRIFGDITAERSGSFSTSLATGFILSGGDGLKYIFAQIQSGNNWTTHYADTIILDAHLPVITGTLASGSTIVSGGSYNTTGITITFYDANLSGTILSGLDNSYFSGSLGSGAVITGDGTYIVTVYDLVGGSASITFTIDTSVSLDPLVVTYFGSGNSGTTYTQHWTGYTSGSCLASGMSVVYVSAGTSTLPLTLSDNTLYVLTGTDYIVTGSVQLGTCSALVSQSGSRLFSSAQIATLLTITGDNFVILDNITVNGESNGSGSTHLRNPNGIKIQNANNITIHDSKFYRNGTAPEVACGIHVLNANYLHIVGTDIYEDADYGLSLDTSNYNLVEDSSFYNNGVAGVLLSGSSYNVFNNVKTYNNYGDIYNGLSNFGMEIKLASRYNAFNNMAIFNNVNAGIKISNSSTNAFNNMTIFNNGYGINSATSNSLSLYNVNVYNNYYGISGATSTGSYNGEIKLFDNISDNTTPSWLTSGSAISSLGRATGYATTGANSWNYFINPKNGSGTYLLNWATSLSALRSVPAWSGERLPVSYSFGGYLPLQIQPVLYSNTALATGGTYNATHFAGVSMAPISGSISINGALYINTTAITVNVTSATTPNYRIFGDVTSEKSGAYTTSITTGFTLSGSDGTKQVLVQLWNNTTDRATHYADYVILDTTAPSFTGTLVSGTVITSGGYYNTGVSITFNDTNLSGALLDGTAYTSGTVITGDGTHVFIVYDLAGNSTGTTFVIDTTNPLVTPISPISGATITGTYTIPFIWSGVETNLSGYTLYISGTTFTGSYATGATGYTVDLANGSYYRYIVSRDLAGNSTSSSLIPFTVAVPFSGYVSLSGGTIQLSGSAKYVSNSFPVYMFSNTTCTYTISGDTTTGYNGVLTGGTPLTIAAVASGADGVKTLYVALSSGAETLSSTLTGYLDTTAPSGPTLSSPISGAIVSGAISLSWAAATDTGVGLSGYRWYVSTTGTFASTTLSGFATGTSTILATGSIGNTGTFYWRIISQDKLGRTGVSLYRDFYYSGEIFTPTSFTFDRISNARLNRTYLSSTEEIEGLSSGTYSLATVSRGILYINDDEIGSTGLVKNGDTVNIELISSDEYEDTVTSTLTIGSFSTTFRVTTREETTSDSEDEDIEDIDDIDTDLSSTEKLQIVAVFLALKDIYSDSTLRTTFFNALLDSLQNRIDDLDDTNDNDQKKIDALQYLYDIIENYLGGDITTDDTIIGGNNWHVAPNGKIYQISYNSSTKLYTSPNFIFKKTFTTLAAMKAYIDANNGGGGTYQGGTFSASAGWNHTVDQTRQSANYVAPNGKSYRLFKTTDGRYSSYNFVSAKYFISVEALKNHIYQWNK